MTFFQTIGQNLISPVESLLDQKCQVTRRIMAADIQEPNRTDCQFGPKTEAATLNNSVSNDPNCDRLPPSSLKIMSLVLVKVEIVEANNSDTHAHRAK